MKVLKPGGKLIPISGPPDPDFAKEQGLSWFLKLVMTLLSAGIWKKAKRHRVSYSFLFMRANGGQLRVVSSIIDSGIIGPTVERIFHSDLRMRLWLMSKPGARKARSSSR
jgi:alcohol dehydrogenase